MIRFIAGDSLTMTPRAEMISMLSRATRLAVRIGETVYEGPVVMMDEEGFVTLRFEASQGDDPLVSDEPGPVASSSVVPAAGRKRPRGARGSAGR